MFRAMFRQCSYFFSHFKVSPNPNQNPKLWAHRQRQLRVFSQNPFLPCDVLPSTNELADSGPSTLTPEKFTEDEKIEETLQAEQHMDKEWGNRPSVWLSLFYDLAWTATFASLTENRQLQTPWDSASYVFFFVTAWWIWVSELFYSVDFYTDDWLHMICMVLDLLIFGALATTTHDFDITAYINHAPGTLDRETPDGESMSPDLYRAQEVAFNSRTVITMVIAISRLILLAKHLEVARHAKSTPRQNKPYPFRLLLIPASLFVSTALFFVAYKVTRDRGRSENGAQTMLILWGAALLVEGAAHIVEFKMHYYERSGLKLRSHGSIVDRFYGITIIIIGEGVNSIAGKLYSLEKAHGLGKAAVANIICCPIIVCFLAYLYFEGPNPLKPVRRRLLWAMTHLPWLLSVILLLEGIKEQILEMTMTYSTNYSRYRFDEYTLAVNTTRQLSNPETKSQLQDILLQGGLSYAEEWPKFLKLLQDQASRGYNISDFDAYWESGIAIYFEFE
ncbi:hypothetical protein BDV93DRAFT_566783 [Ceratobasidium sp. AG-I]|nr:hypothetical protein BDV93DRAFT_566783 [Ceratobasidium sp. AG-I]